MPMQRLIERVSVSSSGEQANGGSSGAAFSADGNYVVFFSEADNLVVGDTNNYRNIFVRDLINGSTERINLPPPGQVGPFGDPNDQANGQSSGSVAQILWGIYLVNPVR